MASKKKGNQNPRLSVQQIKSQIKAAGYGWKAGTTSISQQSESEQNKRLGLEVPEREMERVSMAQAQDTRTFTFSPKRDWRNKDGKDWITPIKDQGSCGSCVAFATNATIESQARIDYDKYLWDVNLSESDLFFCGAGRKCQQGWWPSYALDYARDHGISDEKCFPYQDTDMDCTLCGDKSDRMLKIESWQEIINIDQRKEWLDKKGPLVACMAIYRDFYSYKEGVYRHVTGDLAGYHAICCVGYDDDEGCWICKNSWGDGWGDKGFFKIAYGEADMDTRFAMYGAEKVSGTLAPNNEDDDETEKVDWAEQLVFDHSFEEDRNILWAYIAGKWRHRIISNAEYSSLSSSLLESDHVQAFYKDTNITRIRGWKKYLKDKVQTANMMA